MKIPLFGRNTQEPDLEARKAELLHDIALANEAEARWPAVEEYTKLAGDRLVRELAKEERRTVEALIEYHVKAQLLIEQYDLLLLRRHNGAAAQQELAALMQEEHYETVNAAA